MSVGSWVLYFLVLSSSAGDCSWWFSGVVLYARSARSMSSPASMVLRIEFFIVCTYLSARPFDCGYRGDEITCWMFQVRVKSANSDDVYWVPPSDTRMHGGPCSAKMTLSSLMSAAETVELIEHLGECAVS